MNKNSGFTLLEVLLSIAIIGIMIAIIIFSFPVFQSRQVVRNAGAEVVTAIDKVRTNTMSGYGDTTYGLHVGSTTLTMFTGSTYSATSNTNQTLFTSSDVSFTPHVSGGGSDIMFKRLSGEALQTGSITVADINNSSHSVSVVITTSGQASY